MIAAVRRLFTLRPTIEGPPLFRFDPGWLLVISGLALMASAVLIPAMNDLAEAEWRRNQAIALEQYRAERLVNYSDYLDAVATGQRTVVVSLVATQLNRIPADRDLLLVEVDPRGMSEASVFGPLEPEFRPVPPPARPASTLQRLASGEVTRLWLFSIGATCLLVGLLPPSSGSSGRWRGRLGRLLPFGIGERDGLAPTAFDDPGFPEDSPEYAAIAQAEEEEGFEGEDEPLDPPAQA